MNLSILKQGIIVFHCALKVQITYSWHHSLLTFLASFPTIIICTVYNSN